MTQRALLAIIGLACLLCGCADDTSAIRDRSGSGVVQPWRLPEGDRIAGKGAKPPRELNPFAGDMPANSTLIPLPERVDMVHDDKRNLLYVSTQGGEVRRWNLETRQVVGTWNLGGTLLGMDLSPDGDTLIVADKWLSPSSTPRIHRIDLLDESTHPIALPDTGTGTGAGSFSVAFIDDSRVMVSSARSDTSSLQLVTLDDEQSRILRPVRSQTLLASDPTRSFIAYATLIDPAGTFGSYSVADDEFHEATAGARLFDIAVSPNGERYALATSKELRLLDSSLNADGAITTGEGNPIATAFGSLSDQIYVAWLSSRPAIEVYDATSHQRIAQLHDTRSFSSLGQPPFISGHMKRSRDGRWLFASVDEGILALALAP